MKKSELKTGMILEMENGDLCMALLGTEGGDIISGQTWFPLNNATDEALFGEQRGPYAVEAVYQPFGNMDYLLDGNVNLKGCKRIWKYQQTKEMTVEEIQQVLGCKIKVVESHK